MSNDWIISSIPLLLLYCNNYTAGYSSPVKSIGIVLATLDVLTSFASVAISANKPYVRPEMLPSEAGQFNLIQVRHPCLEVQEGVDYIANDVNFKRGNYFYKYNSRYLLCF